MPADRTITPPRPGTFSTLWTSRPVGMWRSGMQLPARGSTCEAELITTSPAVTPRGARM